MGIHIFHQFLFNSCVYCKEMLFTFWTCPTNFCDRFYVRADIFEGKFCATPNTNKNREIKKKSKCYSAPESMGNLTVTVFWIQLQYYFPL